MGPELRTKQSLWVEVDVRLCSAAEPIARRLMLEQHPGPVLQPEVLDEYLERSETFLTVHDRTSPACELLGKDCLTWLRTAVPESELDEADLFCTNRFVDVQLADGQQLRGHLVYAIGDPNAQLEQFINLQGNYFELLQTDHLYFLNKRFVATIREVSP